MTANFTRRDLPALVLLLLAALAFVWPLFVPGWIIPQGGGDLASFLWPTYRYAAQHLQLSSLSSNPQSLLWNPTLYSGAPFAADNQTSLFYPPNLILFLLLPDFPYQALEVLVAFHLFLAGAGMYFLMKFELSNLGFWKLEVGIFSALAFMASDVFITHLGNYNIVAVSAWLPSIFLCLRQSLINLSAPRLTLDALRPPSLTGLCLGLAILAGHAQMTFIIALACGLYGVYELIQQRHWRVLVLGGVAVLVALGLAAISLLPALEMLQYTARSALSYDEAARWSLPPLGLAGMISPLVFGRGASGWWPAWDRVEVGYLGLTTLLVLLQLRNLKRWPLGFWLLGLGLFSLFIAFGKYMPVHYLLFKLVPGFASLRVPARFILLANFAMSMLAGYAVAQLGPKPAGLNWRPSLVAGIGACLFVAVAPLALDHPPAWQPSLIALAILILTLGLLRYQPVLLPILLFVELFSFSGFVEIDRADPNAGYQHGPAVEYLLAQPGPTRIDVASGPWQPDAPAVFGLESITGITNPLALAHYDRYYWSVGYRGSPQYNFLNAQFVVAAKDSPPADSTFVPVFNEDPAVDIYLNTNAMPRVHLIYKANYVSDPQAAFGAVHDPGFDPATQVILETQPPDNLPAPPPNGATNLFYVTYSSGRFVVATHSPAPAYLVVAEVWYPGWIATLNGQPAEIIRANSAFMAVLVPAGDNVVDFQFTSPLFILGALLSVSTLIATITLLLFRFRR